MLLLWVEVFPVQPLPTCYQKITGRLLYWKKKVFWVAGLRLFITEAILIPWGPGRFLRGMKKKNAYQVATEALARVGLGEHLNQLPSQLSGGEQQRASIARAIAHRPNILFADEPTANLDNESSRMIMDIFVKLHNEGQTIIMVTHEEPYGKLAQKIIRLDDGKIIKIEKN